MSPLFAFFGLGWGEIIIIGIIAVLLFGRKLPDMAKYLGKSVVEFKKGMHGLEAGFDETANPNAQQQPNAPAAAPAEPVRPPQRVAPAAPKFDDGPAPKPAPAPVNSQVTTNPPQP
ncbi:MAG: twin-arginine translocase TatA/TatE family subunit [Planctomycetes bacterium]|nr:twin-arginine translocase TatA/TatE family subunit [Planctomycetota bacterium]